MRILECADEDLYHLSRKKRLVLELSFVSYQETVSNLSFVLVKNTIILGFSIR
jgi:hypothetical protein